MFSTGSGVSGDHEGGRVRRGDRESAVYSDGNIQGTEVILASQLSRRTKSVGYLRLFYGTSHARLAIVAEVRNDRRRTSSFARTTEANSACFYQRRWQSTKSSIWQDSRIQRGDGSDRRVHQHQRHGRLRRQLHSAPVDPETFRSVETSVVSPSMKPSGHRHIRCRHHLRITKNGFSSRPESSPLLRLRTCGELLASSSRVIFAWV